VLVLDLLLEIFHRIGRLDDDRKQPTVGGFDLELELLVLRRRRRRIIILLLVVAEHLLGLFPEELALLLLLFLLPVLLLLVGGDEIGRIHAGEADFVVRQKDAVRVHLVVIVPRVLDDDDLVVEVYQPPDLHPIVFEVEGLDVDLLHVLTAVRLPDLDVPHVVDVARRSGLSKKRWLLWGRRRRHFRCLLLFVVVVVVVPATDGGRARSRLGRRVRRRNALG